MNEPFNLEELQQLPLPRATPEDFSFKEVPREVCAAYVQRFLPPRHVPAPWGYGIACVGCGVDLLDGNFAWSLRHGEGYCTTCKYPARLYHYFKLENVEQEARGEYMLQYHPDELRRVDRSS